MRACYTSYPKRMFFIEVDKHINRAMLWQSSAVTAPPKKPRNTDTHSHTQPQAFSSVYFLDHKSI